MKNVTRTGSLTAALLLALLTGGAMAQSAAPAPAAAQTGKADSGKANTAQPGADKPAAGKAGESKTDATPTPDAVNRPMTEREYYARMEAAFYKQDINGDGYLTRGPLLKEATAEQVAEMDTDGDGRISKAEFLDYALKNFRGRPKYEMNRAPKP
ncbi:EF-hand domain-containing protein [Streptomyces cavourensis]|nr:EF-hand domain-containing protein [Streptomyces cavourensis]